MTSFFEIGGKLVECDFQLTYGMGHLFVFNELPPLGGAEGVPRNPILDDLALTAGSTLVAVASGEDGYSPFTAMNGWSQLRRAKWAGTTAASLALADGPLPFGDALAVGVLSAFAAYEAYHGIKNIVQ